MLCLLAGLARIAVWVVFIAALAVAGGSGLQARRIDYESVRVLPGPLGSDDNYLAQFGLSSTLVDNALAAVPLSEPIVLVRRQDAVLFQEFSILSYTTWPRRLYVVGCGDDGTPEYVDFAPPTATASVAIVEREHMPAWSPDDLVQPIGGNVWLVRTSVERAWATFCQ